MRPGGAELEDSTGIDIASSLTLSRPYIPALAATSPCENRKAFADIHCMHLSVGETVPATGSWLIISSPLQARFFARLM